MGIDKVDGVLVSKGVSTPHAETVWGAWDVHDDDGGISRIRF